MTIAPSSDGWRSTLSQDADDHVQAVVEEDRGLLVDARDVQPLGGVGAEHDDAIGARRVAGVGHAAGLQLRAHGAPEPRRGGLDRKLKARLPERVVDRHRADEVAADVDVRQRAGGDDAVEALEAILGRGRAARSPPSWRRAGPARRRCPSRRPRRSARRSGARRSSRGRASRRARRRRRRCRAPSAPRGPGRASSPAPGLGEQVAQRQPRPPGTRVAGRPPSADRSRGRLGARIRRAPAAGRRPCSCGAACARRPPRRG